MKTFTIENETNDITVYASAAKPRQPPIPNDSRAKTSWRRWQPNGPQPGWSRSGTACRAKRR